MLYPPYPDELLSSWIIRNSIAQGSDPMGWVYGFWGEWRAWTRDIDRFLPESKIVELSRFSRLSTETIYDMTLAPVIALIEGSTPDVNKIWRWVIPTGRRNRSVVGGMQFCPHCLKDDGNIFPRSRRLSWHTHCPIHHIPLLEACDRCAMPFSPHLIDYKAPYVYLCPRCGKDLRASGTLPPSPQVFGLQQMLDKILLLPYDNPCPQWKLQTKREFFLFLRDLIGLSAIISRRAVRYEAWQIFLFGKPCYKKLSSRSGHTFDMRSIEERISLLSIVSHLLSRKPAYLIESLEHIKTTQAILNNRGFPLSDAMRDILLYLPLQTAISRTTSGSKEPVSREPRTAEEVEREMRKIREYL